MAPVSCPPWPGSRTIVNGFLVPSRSGNAVAPVPLPPAASFPALPRGAGIRAARSAGSGVGASDAGDFSNPARGAGAGAAALAGFPGGGTPACASVRPSSPAPGRDTSTTNRSGSVSVCVRSFTPAGWQTKITSMPLARRVVCTDRIIPLENSRRRMLASTPAPGIRIRTGPPGGCSIVHSYDPVSSSTTRVNSGCFPIRILEIPAVVDTVATVSRGGVEEPDGGLCELSGCPAITVGARHSTALVTIATATRIRVVHDCLVSGKAIFIRLSGRFDPII